MVVVTLLPFAARQASPAGLVRVPVLVLTVVVRLDDVPSRLLPPVSVKLPVELAPAW